MRSVADLCDARLFLSLSLSTSQNGDNERAVCSRHCAVSCESDALFLFYLFPRSQPWSHQRIRYCSVLGFYKQWSLYARWKEAARDAIKQQKKAFNHLQTCGASMPCRAFFFSPLFTLVLYSKAVHLNLSYLFVFFFFLGVCVRGCNVVLCWLRLKEEARHETRSFFFFFWALFLCPVLWRLFMSLRALVVSSWYMSGVELFFFSVLFRCVPLRGFFFPYY